MSRLTVTLKRDTCIWRFVHNTLAFMSDSSEKGRPFFKDYLSSNAKFLLNVLVACIYLCHFYFARIIYVPALFCNNVTTKILFHSLFVVVKAISIT